MGKFYIFSVVLHLVLGSFLYVNSNIKKPTLEDIPIKKISVNLSMGYKDGNEIVDIAEIKEEETKEIKEKKVEIVKKVETVPKKVVPKKNIPKGNTKEKVRTTNYDEFKESGKFSTDSEGNFIALSNDGIEFEFVKTATPRYPTVAKKMRYNREAVVKTKFLVGINGEIEDVEIIGGVDKFGFKEETLKALAQWKFKPIVYKGKNIKVYFYKDFKFNVGV